MLRRDIGLSLSSVAIALALACASPSPARAQQIEEVPSQNLSANIFVLPGLSHGFVGQWAGWISPDRASFHGSKLPAPIADGIFFGERRGVVYMRKIFFGPRKSALTAKEITALAPNRAQYTAHWSCASCTPPFVTKVVATFTLISRHALRDEHVNQIYYPDAAKPSRSRTWIGVLHPYDAAKDRAWKEAIARQGRGLVYRGKLTESHPAGEEAR